MENMIFSLNATMPIFFTMVIGWCLKKMGIIDDAFVSRLNKFVFKVALPVMLFKDLAVVDFTIVWDMRFVVFCFVVTLVSILGLTGISYLLKDRSVQGEFIQASYRSSAAILGIAFIQNIYGNSGMGPLMIFASVPLYNVVAVIVLSVMKPERKPLSKELMVHTLKDIVTNPIILGIVAGMIWSFLKIPMPVMVLKTVNNVGSLATPLGMMAMGASFELSQITRRKAPTIAATLIKLVILTAIFLPCAVYFGFREEKLIAILVMLGSASTVSGYIMAKNMGHEGIVSTNVSMLTTLLSSLTLTLWLYLIKSLNLI